MLNIWSVNVAERKRTDAWANLKQQNALKWNINRVTYYFLNEKNVASMLQ